MHIRVYTLHGYYTTTCTIKTIAMKYIATQVIKVEPTTVLLNAIQRARV